MAEIVNLVLRAAGCDLRINEDDIADPDNAPSRVAEIQEEFQTVSSERLINTRRILTESSTS